MTGGAFFMGLLLVLALVRTCKAEEPWTPDDFDWSSLRVAPKEEWNGLYLNLTETHLAMDSQLMQMGKQGELDGHHVLFLPFAVGLAWQALNVAVAAGSMATAIQGCATNDGSPGAVAGCVFGIAGTALSIGSGFKAAQSAGWFARASNTWDQSGLESIALDVFNKRSQDAWQEMHDELLHDVLRRAFGAPEFMGYVSDGHRLSRRNDEHLHPRAPIYRIKHPRHGHMDIAAREHVNGTRFTLSYANHGLGKRQSFQHERLSDHLFEGRFDSSARAADPALPAFDPAGAYQQIEDSIQCIGAGSWREGQVLSAQMYDDTNKLTFGFASMGIFENHDADSTLQDFQPSGMPLLPPTC
ncbi:hypothetical protein DL764_000965 [Monosporascus ibericus]|uniref:Uncharacterized protein n=1 Tax=Monosporascus ibericus TaxID=155417 RepID=A0A4Q4TWH0_9PEZI|nr:hypothetical protein DL764_000965 [Monosporascus ibericus]